MAWTAIARPNRMRALASHTQVVGGLLAEGFAWKMDENYSHARGPARTGKPDPKTGRKRSVPGEFPQEQTGLLRSGIFHELVSDYSSDYVHAKAGLDTDVSKDPSALFEYLVYIEARIEDRGGRAGLTMTGESAETHTYMLEHLKRHLDPSRFMVPR